MTDTPLWRALERVLDPEIRRPITELGMVESATVDDAGVASVSLLLTITGCPAANTIEQATIRAAESAEGVTEARVQVGVMSPEQRAEFVKTVRGDAPPQRYGPDSLTRVIAVTSGKGGVGKSSVTANLGVALAARGFTVGIVDADVFGFSIPAIMGLTTDGVTVTPTRVADLIIPPVAHDVQVISIGMFLGDADSRDTAVSWRGPMLHRTIEQFLRDVWFGDLDVLLLDLPPGTGDVALSVGQLLPQAEVIVVTTPQSASTDVAVRSGLVALQTGQTILGVVENMAGLTQPDGSVLDLFGSGGGDEVAERLTQHTADGSPVQVIGRIPISVALREAGDTGHPIVAAVNDDPAKAAIETIADTVVSRGRGLTARKLPIAPAMPGAPA